MLKIEFRLHQGICRQKCTGVCLYCKVEYCANLCTVSNHVKAFGNDLVKTVTNSIPECSQVKLQGFIFLAHKINNKTTAKSYIGNHYLHQSFEV